MWAILLVMSAALAQAFAQGNAPRSAPPGDVTGIGPYLHLVADLDRSLDFYRALLGTEPDGTAETRAWGRNDPVAEMYSATGAEIRTATLPVPGSDITVELVAWRGVDRPRVEPAIADPGVAVLLLFVRDIERALAAVTAHGGSVVTPGGRPVARDANRFAVIRDPDGFFVELLQTATIPAQSPSGNIVAGRFRATVDDLAAAMRFYRNAFGFALPEAGDLREDPVVQGMTGLRAARSCIVMGIVPGSSLTFELMQFSGVPRTRVRADIHGIGASMLRLRVRDIDAVLAKATAAGARSVTPRPITLKDNRRMVIVEDPNGLYVQLWQPAP